MLTAAGGTAYPSSQPSKPRRAVAASASAAERELAFKAFFQSFQLARPRPIELLPPRARFGPEPDASADEQPPDTAAELRSGATTPEEPATATPPSTPPPPRLVRVELVSSPVVRPSATRIEDRLPASPAVPVRHLGLNGGSPHVVQALRPFLSAVATVPLGNAALCRFVANPNVIPARQPQLRPFASAVAALPVTVATLKPPMPPKPPPPMPPLPTTRARLQAFSANVRQVPPRANLRAFQADVRAVPPVDNAARAIAQRRAAYYAAVLPRLEHMARLRRASAHLTAQLLALTGSTAATRLQPFQADTAQLPARAARPVLTRFTREVTAVPSRAAESRHVRALSPRDDDEARHARLRAVNIHLSSALASLGGVGGVGGVDVGGVRAAPPRLLAFARRVDELPGGRLSAPP